MVFNHLKHKILLKCEIDGRSIDQQKQNNVNIDLHTQNKYTQY
jgi:hypothetical protein